MTTYEIRKDGRVWVRSPIPDCGYSPDQLRSLRAHGFKLHTVGADSIRPKPRKEN